MQADQDRRDGYVVGVQYPAVFSRHSSPTLIQFVALMHGRAAVDPNRACASFDLGCGRGFTSALLAAANPHRQFLAHDFNSKHIWSARELVAAADVTNAQFLEASFAELAQQDLPDFDS